MSDHNFAMPPSSSTYPMGFMRTKDHSIGTWGFWDISLQAAQVDRDKAFVHFASSQGRSRNPSFKLRGVA